MKYCLPLTVSALLRLFKLDVTVEFERELYGYPQLSNEMKVMSAPATFSASQIGNLSSYALHVVRQSVIPSGISFTLPISAVPLPSILLETDEKLSYFCIRDKGIPSNRAHSKTKRIGVFWDTSASAKNSAATDNFCEVVYRICVQFEPEEIALYYFASSISEVKIFTAPMPLIVELQYAEYTGGTNLSCLSSIKERLCDFYLLFSDGLCTWGDPNPTVKLPKPVHTFCNGDGPTNFPLLKLIAKTTGGTFFNLKTTPTQSIVDSLSHEPLMVLSWSLQIGRVKVETNRDIYPLCPFPIYGMFEIHGKLADHSCPTTLVLKLGHLTSGPIIQREYRLVPSPTYSGLIARQWAIKKVDSLLLESHSSPVRDLVLSLGRQYHFVTPNSSLLVLSTLDQFLKHQVEPPPCLPEVLQQYLLKIDGRKRLDQKKREQKAVYMKSLWHQQCSLRSKHYDGTKEQPLLCHFADLTKHVDVWGDPTVDFIPEPIVEEAEIIPEVEIKTCIEKCSDFKEFVLSRYMSQFPEMQPNSSQVCKLLNDLYEGRLNPSLEEQMLKEHGSNYAAWIDFSHFWDLYVWCSDNCSNKEVLSRVELLKYDCNCADALCCRDSCRSLYLSEAMSMLCPLHEIRPAREFSFLSARHSRAVLGVKKHIVCAALDNAWNNSPQNVLSARCECDPSLEQELCKPSDSLTVFLEPPRTCITFELEDIREVTVSKIKELLEVEGFPIKDQLISWNGTPLADSKFIFEYNFSQGCPLQLTMKKSHMPLAVFQDSPKIPLSCERALFSMLSIPPPSNIKIFRVGNALIKSYIRGEHQTPYESRFFEVLFQIPPEFPEKPPLMKMCTPVIHPDITPNGEIGGDVSQLCLHNWNPSITFVNILSTLSSMLSQDLSPEIRDKAYIHCLEFALTEIPQLQDIAQYTGNSFKQLRTVVSSSEIDPALKSHYRSSESRQTVEYTYQTCHSTVTDPVQILQLALLVERFPDFAVKVISNIAELELDNAQNIRVAAAFAEKLTRFKTAADLYERVLQLRPEEPQSYRDLALCLVQVNESGENLQRALTLLNRVVEGEWDRRFQQVELTAVNDMYFIWKIVQELGLCSEVKLPISPTFLECNLDLDIRVVLTWNNSADVDLVVVEPTGEECSPFHNHTKIGGVLSEDFTEGFGPVVYSISDAVEGQYDFYASVFHPGTSLNKETVCISHIYTNFGRVLAQQSSVNIVILPNPKERQLLASVYVG
ncbi:YfaP family protein [Pelomyxa schiedti]|nr:YfaP family protein [Pelomyxa schiedti]